MSRKLRELHAHEYENVCAWAIKENWPGLVKGEVITHEGFLKILMLPGHLSFAMSEEGASALGFGQIWLSPNGKTNLIRILVDPAMRGRGIGKNLCALLLAEALRISNTAQVFLRVRRDNLPAVAVYRFLSFKDIEGESNADVLAMAYGL
ncbi:GNAT family N-acetyltransferase [Iodobacter fluviatilis]|uniref:Acetyltransferase (GNAT) family protein n=1 Tax=Iodobacter fluviatilis TaxID=537 RepID=A0A377Q979_9NEIS|nr:GNAT family N-acetyltransferase [Iodobacter fluviatilis]TCU88809.1 acetyltransferase (GNAT) family protein [Iodobacter fluviatilis]STQ91119.1 ribosomal-protein-alanine N-acetyltransferase [Iodobacter fluviatilis]